ncbi:MAG: glycosyltransferase family 2 protein [Chitinophagaceae bacterium]|nr:glycosyltransferase family 2 protein [Chitinophagaceae bacterium]
MKFSIIVPTYKRIEFLDKAIESINAQTYRNYDIIVVNDNPNDKSIVDAFCSKFEKLIVCHSSHTKGGNGARNLGISKSDGELIAFLDDDDLWLPEKLEKHFEMHKQYPEAGLVFSDCLYIYNDPLVSDNATCYNVPTDVVKAMGKAKFCPATTSMVSIKRECIERCGLFDETLVSFQDWDYWFRIAHNFRFIHVPIILVHFRQHLGNRTSQNENDRLEGLKQICDKWKKEIEIKRFFRSWIRIFYYRNSLNALLAGDKSTAFKKSLKLLNSKVICINSIRSFFSLLMHLSRRIVNYSKKTNKHLKDNHILIIEFCYLFLQIANYP